MVDAENHIYCFPQQKQLHIITQQIYGPHEENQQGGE